MECLHGGTHLVHELCNVLHILVFWVSFCTGDTFRVLCLELAFESQSDLLNTSSGGQSRDRLTNAATVFQVFSSYFLLLFLLGPR